MGQHWILFNLDKNESGPSNVDASGKLMELFFHISESTFVSLFLSEQPGHNAWGGDRIVLLGSDSRGLPPDTVKDDDPPILKEEVNPETSAWGRWTCDCKEAEDIKDASSHLPGDTVYILRSLNRKEYVRRDTVEDYRPFCRSPPPGLSQALCTLVGWSTNSDFSNVCCSAGYIPASGGTDVCLYRGTWSGNRIDIVAFTDEMQKTLDEEGWTDISEEKARHVSDLYASIGF